MTCHGLDLYSVRVSTFTLNSAGPRLKLREEWGQGKDR
jgi:hypothetical protein